MGQSFGDSGVYVGWSSLFSYNTILELEASKTIPIPKRTNLVVTEGSNYNITEDLDAINNEKIKANRIKLYAKLIQKIDDNDGKYNYTFVDDEDKKAKQKIINKIKNHEKYLPSSNKLRSAAFKNSASSNIFTIVHSIRNRYYAYSPITMKDLRALAENSPKGKKTKLLNSLNPFAKYIMQNQNIIGKDVIGIAANGEKDWFNLTQYYQMILRSNNSNDLFYLKMSHTYNRIAGRADGKLKSVTVRYIPDLWNSDPGIKRKMEELFGKDFNNVDELIAEMDDKQVDLMISQLLSAATDNAKELILSKINSGTNLAKYYLHLIMSGFALKDIVAFMTSPVVEMIDKYSSNNSYLKFNLGINSAIKLLNGNVDLTGILISPRMSYEERMFLEEYETERQIALLESGEIDRTVNDKLKWVFQYIPDLRSKYKANTFGEFLQAYILANTGRSLSDEMDKLEGTLLPTDTNNMSVNYAFSMINNLVSEINSAIQSENDRVGNYDGTNFSEDLAEFESVTKQANETSDLASTWLKLNQGIPQTDILLTKLIKKMNGTVSGRENAMGIYSESEENYEQIIKILQSMDDQGNVSGDDSKLVTKYLNVINNIVANNPELTYDEIREILIDAARTKLLGNFDLYKFLNNDKVYLPETNTYYSSRASDSDQVSYRELASKYFNLIKSNWNVLDIVTRIPHYSKILDLLNYTLLQRRLFSVKAKIIDRVLENPTLTYMKNDDALFKKINDYADKVIVLSYFLSKDNPLSLKGFDDTYKFTPEYDELPASEIFLNTLNGIDSLKNFVETKLLDYLRSKYGDNDLVKDLVLTSYKGITILKTKLDLSTIDDSFSNRKTMDKYLVALNELKESTKDHPELFNGEYSIADILMLYNLAVNNNKLGGKFLTALFSESVTPGTELYKYYLYLGKQDSKELSDSIIDMITDENDKDSTTDFLVYIAPTVYSERSLIYRTEPYVKVSDQTNGIRIFKRIKDGKNGFTYVFNGYPLNLEGSGLTEGERLQRLKRYLDESLYSFLNLHNKITNRNLFTESGDYDLRGQVNTLIRFIRQGRLLIYKNC